MRGLVGYIFSNLLAFSGAKQGESEGDLRPFATLRWSPSGFHTGANLAGLWAVPNKDGPPQGFISYQTSNSC